MIDRYFERFPGIRDYIHATLTRVRETGFTTTAVRPQDPLSRHKSKVSTSGRGRSGPRQRADPGDQRRHHQAGDGADVPALEDGGLGSTRMLMQVHDELVFEVPKRVETGQRVYPGGDGACAEPAVTLSVPLGVDIGTGANWGAAH
jgi:DNA polymerase-1